jgi:hypothetical protein
MDGAVYGRGKQDDGDVSPQLEGGRAMNTPLDVIQ